MEYYAVANANGPISVHLGGDIDAAISEFESADLREWIDSGRTDIEDDLDICGDGMSEEEFDSDLESVGAVPVLDLDPIHNYHSGTSSHRLGGWYLWRVDD